MTKEEITKKVKDLINKTRSLFYKVTDVKEDINALWHWCKCLDERLIKQRQEIKELREELQNKSITSETSKTD
tara:strand:- start:63 stop:281 length:219 start_codon:yes stop_codon:yes gene_type:complete